MNCLWILVLLFLCNNGRNCGSCNNDDCGCQGTMSERDDCGCERMKSSNDDCGGSTSRRFGDDNGLFDMPRGGEMGRMPSNFQRNTCGCEMPEQ